MSTVISPDLEALDKEADEAWKAIYEKKNGNIPPEDGTPKEGEPKPEDKPKEEPKPGEKPKEEPKPEDDFKHKYDVLRGKYDAEVPRLAFDLAEANKKLLDLEKKVSEIPKPEPAKEEAKPLPPKLEALKTEYPDIYEAVMELHKSTIEETLSKATEKVAEKVEKKVDKVVEQVEKSDRERFEEAIRLDSEVGKEIDAINNDPRFEQWLKEEDEYMGLPRSALANDAIKRMDKVRTLKFFKNFKKETMVSPTDVMVENPKDKPKVEKKPKEADIAPPRGGGGGNPPMDTKPAVDPIKAYLDFQDDVQNGKWKGKEAEMEAEDKRLHALAFKRKSKT